jgi:hypothetical protein
MDKPQHLNRSATYRESKDKLYLFVDLHTLVCKRMPYEICRTPQSCLHMLDFSNDRAQPTSDACPIPGTKSW